MYKRTCDPPLRVIWVIHRGDNDGQQLDPGNSGLETLINATQKNEHMDRFDDDQFVTTIKLF